MIDRKGWEGKPRQSEERGRDRGRSRCRRGQKDGDTGRSRCRRG